MKYAGLAGAAFALLVACSSATGASLDSVLLSSDDYVYLATQGIERDHSILQHMSPKELRQLHYAISDQRTEGGPAG